MVGEGNLHICWEMFKKELVRNINGKNDEDSKPTGRFFSRLKAMTQGEFERQSRAQAVDFRISQLTSLWKGEGNGRGGMEEEEERRKGVNLSRGRYMP